MAITKICPECGEEFTIEGRGSTVRKYCSLSCQRRATANAKNARDKNRMSDYNHKGYLSKTIINRYNGKCAICGWRATNELIKTDRGTQYAYGNEIHHIIPISQGGKATEENLILLCPNHHKQAHMGVLSQQTLKRHIISAPTAARKQAMSNSAVDRVTAAIFGEM